MTQVFESSASDVFSIDSASQLEEFLTIKSKFRFFYHNSFDDPDQISFIVDEIPNFDEFCSKTNKIRKSTNWNVIQPELRPCYQLPLLTKEQEIHLFRKMNYYKYLAKKIMDVEFSELKTSEFEEMKQLLEKALEIRNIIAVANLRLSSQLLKGSINICRDYGITQEVLSDAYHDVLKSIDYFDWTKGVKFSTYATWVLRQNSSREVKKMIRRHENHIALEDHHFESFFSYEDQHEEEKRLIEMKNFIQNALDSMNENERDSRQIFVLTNYFGINFEKQTLEQISKKIGVTKERVRQIKENALK